MKLMYVIGSMELGGAEQHLLRVASALRAQGHKPEVVTLCVGGPLTSAFRENGVPVYGVHLPRLIASLLHHERAVAWAQLLLSAIALWSLYWRRRPDVVHFFLPAAYIIGGVTALFGPRMLRVMSRRSLNHYQAKHRLFTRLEHWLHPRMDLICANSQSVLRDLIREGVSRDRIRLIYNGIAISQFNITDSRDALRSEIGIASDALVFVMVANLIPYKGHADLIEALATIAQKLPSPWICLCIGRDDGIGASLHAQAISKGIDENMRFLGSRKDVPRLLAMADIGVLCSHEEGFSNAVLEGMASGLPIIVSDVGGNAEAVVHGVTGLVVPPHQPAALAEALLSLALNQETRQKMGNHSHRRVKEKFSLEACVDQYVRLYRGELGLETEK